MSYKNVTTTIAEPVNDFFEWIDSRPKNFLNAHILNRGAHLVVCPVSFVANAVDTIVGLGLGVGAICSFGKHKPTLKMAVNHLFNSGNLIVRPYLHLMRTINPRAEFDENDEPRSSLIFGLIDNLSDYLTDVVGDYKDSENFLKKHVTLRLAYGLLTVSILVARAVEGVFSIPVAFVAILAAGTITPLNNLAYQTLSAPSVISDTFVYSIKCLNPWVEIKLKEPQSIL